MSEARSDRWVSVLLSVLVHAAIVGLLGFGWWHFRKPVSAPQQLAIEATVVMETAAAVSVPAAASVPAEASPAPASVPAPPPVPAPAPAPIPAPPSAVEAGRAAAAAQAKRLDDADRAREQRQRDAEQQEAARRAAERAAERAAAEQAAVQKAQALAESAAKLKAQQAAADKARREAELRAQLASEERINAARGSAEMASYLALITGRINRAWIRPSSVRAGLSCVLHVTQVPGGEVTAVQIVSCNGDQAARESIEAAVYRASPLPTPSNPDLFDRNLTIRFHPDE